VEVLMELLSPASILRIAGLIAVTLDVVFTSF
jgi:hypothetical protein